MSSEQPTAQELPDRSKPAEDTPAGPSKGALKKAQKEKEKAGLLSIYPMTHCNPAK